MDDDRDSLADALREALAPAYLVVRRLGQGGMGSVYLAREPALKRPVAVKVMLPDLARDETNRARFEREAQSVAAISHPNVISVYRVGALADGTPFFVMQYVQGKSLDDRLETAGPLGVGEARRVLGEVASALAAAHKRDIVHRDIKPANILQDEESGRVVVTDFGIAAVRPQREAPSPRLTQTGTSLGTPTHMSPEQLLGEPVTDKSDVYSFGILAYELLTGQGPFRITSPHEAVAAHLRDTPPPLSRLRPEVDPELEQIALGCLAKKPEDRPGAAQLAQRLLPGERMPLEWPPPGLETLVGTLPLLSRQAAAGSFLVAVAVLALLLRNPDTGTGVPPWIALALVALGGLLLLRTTWSAAGLLRRIHVKAKRGHRTWTILETLSDRRGDTGALIAGSGEYMTLAPAARAVLRRRRVATALLEMFGAVVPIVGLLIATRALPSMSGPWVPGLVVLGPGLLLLDASWVLRLQESRYVRRPRRSRRRQRGDPAVARNVIETWTASLDVVAANQPMPRMSPRLPRLTGYALLGLVLLALVSATPLVMVDAIGGVIGRIAVPKSGATIRRVRRALVGRDWSAAVDPSITTLAAGAAFHSLEMIGSRAPTNFRPPSATLQSPFEHPGAPPAFARLRQVHPDTLLRRAARGGLSAPERAFLESVAGDPTFRAFTTVAHARAADILAARYDDSTLRATSWNALSLPRSDGIKSVLAAHTAVAALRLAQGRRQEAEALLREEVAFGLALVDHGTTLLDATIGSQIAGGGLDRLEGFYAITGRPEESRRLRAARDSAASLADRDDDLFERRVGQTSDALAELRARLNLALADSTMPPSYRWEFARLVAGESCLDAREMLLGPDPGPARAMAVFARQQVRNHSDSLLWNVVTAGYSRIRAADYGAGPAMRSRVFGLSAGLLGVPRLRDCASILGIVL